MVAAARVGSPCHDQDVCVHGAQAGADTHVDWPLATCHLQGTTDAGSDDEAWYKGVTSGKLTKGDKLTAVDHSQVSNWGGG